ncbi:hypothetical protein [Sphingopyxis terrae]|uniref:hypothetical protein n=1 Tax=Sphingopyxis terrae TaxID=33052 RepID=UPI0036330370
MSKRIIPLALLLILTACSQKSERDMMPVADSAAVDFGAGTSTPASDAAGSASDDDADFD